MTNLDILQDFIKNGTFTNCAILCHTSADPDAIASMIGLEYLLKHYHSDISIDFLIDGISEPSKELITYSELEFLADSVKKYDFLFIVDVNIPNQLGVFKDLVLSQEKEKIIIIDHHSPTEFSQNEVFLSFIDEERTSAAEIIAEMIFNSSLKPTKRLCTILLAGILYDSRRFFHLDSRLLNIINHLFEQEVNYDLAVQLIQKDYDYSEKIARIKCASRLDMQKIHGWIVVWSSIGSHEGSSARAILDLGADVAFIYSNRKNETRLNVRATNNFYINTQVHFGKEIMSTLSERFNGEGGGHSTAAALNIPKIISEKELKTQTFKLLEKQIKENSKLQN
ncbi:MAG: bifunctional oligoribonuclease/PAP phosphatase NrnA [Candidatus Thorarchaeota archaeon]